jgi:hypothetical protein
MDPSVPKPPDAPDRRETRDSADPPDPPAQGESERPHLVRAGKLAGYDADLPGHRSRALAALTGLTALTGASLLLSTVSMGLIPGLLTAGTGAALYLHRRRQMQRMSRFMDRMSAFQRVRNADLDRMDEGTPVRVRGRVRATTTLPGVLEPERRGVWRAIFLHEAVLRQRLLFVEHGWDFDVRDDSGVSVRVQVARARLLIELVADMPWTLDFTHLRADRAGQIEQLMRAVPEAVRGKRAFDPAQLRVWEFVLADGDEVDVLGFASHVIGPGAPALPREAPRQPAITGTDRHPLVIVPGTSTAREPRARGARS